MNGARLEPGSFRDRTARVFRRDQEILRGLNPQALENWERLRSSRFFSRFTETGALVRTEQLSQAQVEQAAHAGELREWAAVLRHERIPFVSYPYEWCFGMLKDAACLQLDLLMAALDEGMVLKDATAFNVQWRGGEPVFIDIASFQPLAPGEPWPGYRQFCRTFLYPLLLQAYRGVPFQPWLRGSLEGIPSDHCWRVLTPRDWFRPGVFTDVYLQAKAEARYADTRRNVRGELRAAGFNSALIAANAKRLRKVIGKLRWTPGTSVWSEYATHNSYEAADAASKQAFVREVAASRRWRLAWDIGCNTGVFSRIAAEHAETVVALDADAVAVERLYQDVKREKIRTILPLVFDLADPSPGLGWRGCERVPLAERGRPDLVLCLALIHHAVIAANIPLDEFMDWLAGLGAELIIEFVTREDPMVQRLLANKDDQYDDYQHDRFEQELRRRFRIERQQTLGSGLRVLYQARPNA